MTQTTAQAEPVAIRIPIWVAIPILVLVAIIAIFWCYRTVYSAKVNTGTPLKSHSDYAEQKAGIYVHSTNGRVAAQVHHLNLTAAAVPAGGYRMHFSYREKERATLAPPGQQKLYRTAMHVAQNASLGQYLGLTDDQIKTVSAVEFPVALTDTESQQLAAACKNFENISKQKDKDQEKDSAHAAVVSLVIQFGNAHVQEHQNTLHKRLADAGAILTNDMIQKAEKWDARSFFGGGTASGGGGRMGWRPRTATGTTQPAAAQPASMTSGRVAPATRPTDPQASVER